MSTPKPRTAVPAPSADPAYEPANAIHVLRQRRRHETDEREALEALEALVDAAHVMVDEAGGRMEGQAWLDLRAALARVERAC